MTMNISSLQPLNTKYMRIGYAAILSSILLLASVATIGLSVAQNNAPEGEWVIHDSQHPCIFNDNAGPDTVAFFWDADGDGAHDHLEGTDPPESVPSEPIACFAAQFDDVDKAQLESLCTIYGDGVVVTRGDRRETLSFGEWLSIQHPDLIDLFNEVGCPISEQALTGLAPVSGTFLALETVVTSSITTQAGDTIIQRTRTWEMAGDISGTLNLIEMVVLGSGGTGTYQALGTFTGTVLGSALGEADFRGQCTVENRGTPQITTSCSFRLDSGEDGLVGLNAIISGGFTGNPEDLPLAPWSGFAVHGQ